MGSGLTVFSLLRGSWSASGLAGFKGVFAGVLSPLAIIFALLVGFLGRALTADCRNWERVRGISSRRR